MKRNNKWGKSFLFLFSIFALLTFTSLYISNPLKKIRAEEEKNTINKELSKESSQEKTITIRSVGDILLHDSVYWNGEIASGSYNFDPMFKSVSKYLENADLTTANMETLVAGNQMGVSSYPFFNVPDQIVDSLLAMGVDIVSAATNHTMDFGAEGAHRSLEILKEKKMEYVGSYESWEDYNRLRIIEKNGIKVGFLNYTYGTNGNPIPEDEQYLVTLIDKKLIPLEVQHIKKACDVVIVIYQFGEDAFLPVDSQIELTQLAIDAGANFVLGGHSHIMQPMKRFNDHQGAWYSHGNFLSGQVKEYEKIGGIGEYTFKMDDQGKVTLDSMRLMPTYNVGLPEWNHYQVIPLVEASDFGLWNGDELYKEVESRFKNYEQDLEFVPYLD
ncbi:CapA family protein [Facklamia miroungae]|uniref:Poly-gamma-glutamate synthesis protein (Capsule biosynthesis protein) n=1 Tax=Facklamia miroungae TaxID=120956 RepID=A0A1G7PB12_9LACT|nr:CapA family protein [Facklamia miroungae]NKZ28625.1 CapA family protein [Facklamia miroungae]SDF82779.1 poly-gamma-glutamate synthesis protein (capsule biosynthesis protein) [Facklamia miroungae]